MLAMMHLTQGLSSARSKAAFSDWRQIVLHRLQGEYHKVPTSAKTREAELGLGLAGEHAYWFLARVETLYGRVLMAWRSTQSFPSPETSVTPYDTGGMWHGHIEMPEISTPDAKRRHVQTWTTSLAEATPMFQDWMREVYANAFEYVSGAAKPDYVLQDAVDPQQNSSLAWSWELRHPKSLNFLDSFELDSIFWEEADLLSFRAYLIESLTGAALRPTLNLLANVSRRAPTVSLAMQMGRQYVTESTQRHCYE